MANRHSVPFPATYLHLIIQNSKVFVVDASSNLKRNSYFKDEQHENSHVKKHYCHSFTIQPHNDIQASLYRRHKVAHMMPP